ncbi:MAG: carboxypeptidase M32 [Chitinophagaceae bacterium]
MTDYEQYQELNQRATDFRNAAALLEWDQETYMPAKGYEARGRQLATLASQAHELLTSGDYAALLERLKADESLDEIQAINVRLSVEDYEKNSKLSREFVAELSKATSTALQAWIEARRKNDYKIFAPELKKMIVLKKQQAVLYGFENHPYDALLDDYEKGVTVARLNPIFGKLRNELPAILSGIAAAPQVDDSFLRNHFPREEQFQFSLEVLKAMGYDFEAGRQDYSEHPFTTSFSPKDVRITTRVDEDDFSSLFWSSVHEGGHALYEQGLPNEQYGLPICAATSLAIHESQSRLWENCIGRGLDFWKHFYKPLQERFSQQLQGVSLEKFYAGMNKVSPSLIRTEADELTYHFHVMIRYEIEKGLLEDSISVEDLPAAWAEKYERYLGITPPDDVQGILQDVHWAHGSFGYFPTYSLGSLYAVQFLQKAKEDLSEMMSQIVAGDFSSLLGWLRQNIHQCGRRYRSEQLCERVTGANLNIEAFLDYAKTKYSGIYKIKL